MTIYVILVFRESYVEEEFATLKMEEANEKYGEFCKKYEADPDTGLNDDESVTVHYLTYEV